MKINNVELVISAVRRTQYPEDNKPEFLLVGRSNVGKSSFINTLIHRKNFARTSSRPGKTQTLNFYLVNDGFYLVDVPGYGYASVSKVQKAKFGKMIEEYLTIRPNLKRVFMLIDFRHKPQSSDLVLYNFLKYHNLPVTVVATKVDKVKSSAVLKQKKLIENTMDLVLNDNIVFFSAVSKEGKTEVQDMIEKIISDS